MKNSNNNSNVNHAKANAKKAKKKAETTSNTGCEMDDLLNQMVISFRKAFPTAKELAMWLARTNDFIINDKNSKDADDAARFTWYLGCFLLPELIEAKTDKGMVIAIKNSFEDIINTIGDNAYNTALPFAVYKHRAEELSYPSFPEFHEEIMNRLTELEKISLLGSEYAELVNELGREQYKSEQQSAIR